MVTVASWAGFVCGLVIWDSPTEDFVRFRSTPTVKATPWQLRRKLFGEKPIPPDGAESYDFERQPPKAEIWK